MSEWVREDATPRWHLPLLHTGQAQKELDHNEALTLLDFAVQPAVAAIGLNVPPTLPSDGACWVVGEDPVGAWAGEARSLAGWTCAGWRFLQAQEGMAVWVIDAGVPARFHGGHWHIGDVRAASFTLNGHLMLAAPQPPIDAAIGGVTVDAEAREALERVLETLRIHHLIKR